MDQPRGAARLYGRGPMTEAPSADIVARYADARVPRYTSYPTAPHFSRDVTEDLYSSWLRALPPATASLYLHVPFCRAMCWYCGCHTTVAAREAPVNRYIECLSRELALVAGRVRGPLDIRHVHFGGGTPTLMQPEQMRVLVQQLRESFSIHDSAELAIEIDPRTLTLEMIEALAECRFNRASLGVQSFDPDVQAAINRVQSFAATEAGVRRLRAAGVGGINFDLIYGLPRQTVASCLATVEQALRLWPDRLSVFGYAHVPSFKPHQRKIDSASLPSSEARFEQSRTIAGALVRAGYVEIGLDHFALPGDPLAAAAANGRLHRNFQGYTTDDAEVLIGVGASAIGRMPQGFVQNEVRLPAYQQLIGEGRLPISRGHLLTGDDRLRGAIIERLMCDRRVDIAGICHQLGADPAKLRTAGRDLDSMERDGLITRRGSMVEVTDSARHLVRVIAAAFDEHLDAQSVHARAV